MAEKLFADGYGSPSLVSWFIAIGDSYSDNPMGVKLKELFKIKYMPSPPRPAGSPPPPRIYSSFANKETVEKCRAFLAVNERSFDLEEERFGVPREIIAALLMVETKLGGYLGKNNPFWSLSCMAAADSPNMVPAPLAALPVQPEHMPWVEETLKARSSWAYKELGSLIRYCADNSVNPVDMKGSVYGAIGLCQFMPSNITRFGVDGNNDGKIDLFSVEDAIHSVGSYFRQNGWKPGLSHEERVTVIKRYNKSNPYANTILYLASEITLANAMGEQSGK